MDNFPEINLPSRKKKQKKGFIPWLRNTLGMGSSGSALGTAGVGGGSTFLGSTFLGGLFAGKGALVATAVITALAVGAGLIVSNYSSDKLKTPGAFDSSGVKQSASSRYTPAILRGRQAGGSSIDMFKGANVGAFDYEEEEAAPEPEETADASVQEPQVPDQTKMAEEMVGRLIGGGLSTSMGEGSGKFSGIGGFGNVFGEGMFGPGLGFGQGLSSMKESPSFGARKKKLLAMKARGRRIVPRRKMGKRPGSKGALAQAKGIKGAQTYTGTDIDSAKSTQDEAWEGTTGEGDVGVPAGGEGISSGGAGLVTSPSIDNTATPMGGDSEQGVPDYADPDTSPQDVSPWKSLVAMAMMMILISAILSAIGGKLVQIGLALMSNPLTAAIGAVIYGIGIALCVIALMLALAAVVMGVMVMTTHGQAMLGMIYVLGGGIAAMAAILAMTGGSVLGVSALWWSAIAGIIALLGSMAGGK